MNYKNEKLPNLTKDGQIATRITEEQKIVSTDKKKRAKIAGIVTGVAAGTIALAALIPSGSDKEPAYDHDRRDTEEVTRESSDSPSKGEILDLDTSFNQQDKDNTIVGTTVPLSIESQLQPKGEISILPPGYMGGDTSGEVVATTIPKELKNAEYPNSEAKPKKGPVPPLSSIPPEFD